MRYARCFFNFCKLSILFLGLNFSWAKLDPQDKELLESGEKIIRSFPLENTSWEEYHIYVLVKATPSKAMEIFSDYEKQKNYIPNLKSSTVIKRDRPTHALVAYEMELPFPAPNSVYQMSHDLAQRGENYVLTWSQVQSNTTEQSYGSATFSPWDENSSLMVYTSAIIPSSIFAVLFKERSKRDLLKTIDVIIQQIENTAK